MEALGYLAYIIYISDSDWIYPESKTIELGDVNDEANAIAAACVDDTAVDGDRAAPDGDGATRARISAAYTRATGEMRINLARAPLWP